MPVAGTSCVMAPPIHLGAWSMAPMPFELLLLFMQLNSLRHSVVLFMQLNREMKLKSHREQKKRHF